MTYDSPKTLPSQEAIRNKEKVLDEGVKKYADLLSVLDQGVENVVIDPQTGKISRTAQSGAPLNSSEYVALRNEYDPKTKAKIEEIKRTGSGFLDISAIAGAIVITYDSSKAPLKAGLIETKPSGERGAHYVAREGVLGTVIIDLNSQNRSALTPPTVTAIHELQHHNLSVTDYLLGQDPKIKMHTGVRSVTSSELFGKNFSDHPSAGHHIAKQAFELDKDQYSVLAERPFVGDDYGDMMAQQAYLDELHSSFLQKKPEWFLANQKIYAGYASGKAWEIVGKFPDDQLSTKKVQAITQAVYIVETYAMPSLKSKALEGNPPMDLVQLLREWPNFFRKIGALIGTSRTVKQAERLIRDEWKTFKSSHQDFFNKNQAAFGGLIQDWETKGYATEFLKQEF